MRARAFLAGIVGAIFLAGCGIFGSSDPNPLHGIWKGPFPTVFSVPADSARWVFTTNNLYLFYALRADGSIVYREVGIYESGGLDLRLYAETTGEPVREDVNYLVKGDVLELAIRGRIYAYVRTGSAREADRFEDVLVRPAKDRAGPP